MAKLSRRRFLTETAAAIAAAPFISTGSTRARAQDSRRVGFALCGLGKLSEHQIAPALAKTRHCRLAGIITGTPAKAEAWKARYGIPDGSVYSYDTMHRMADNPDIDVVYVVTPNALHAAAHHPGRAGRQARLLREADGNLGGALPADDRCLQGRRPPARHRLSLPVRPASPGMHPPGARTSVRRAQHHRGRFRHRRRRPRSMAPEARAGRRRRADGRRHLRAAGHALPHGRGTGAGLRASRPRPTRSSSPKWTKASSGPRASPAASSRTAAPATAPAASRTCASTRERGWFELDPAFYYNGNHGRRSDGKEIRFPEIDLFAAEMDDFAQCILETRPSKVPGEEGLRDVRIMQAIYESVRTGKAVSLAA